MIEKHGWKGEITSVNHLNNLRESVQSRYNQGLIDMEFYKDQLSFLSFDLPADLPEAKSIIIIAVPTPQMRIFFHWNGNRLPVVIPPTYVSYTSRTINTQKILKNWLQPKGFRLSATGLPLKRLAVQSSMARYGRNNICYVDGMGSFLQLVGAFSDMPCEDDHWQSPMMLERCETCQACLKHCPTGAIVKDRFVLHAELCLTYHNESQNEFADWINPSWHHCLVGCMQCQIVCPENRKLRDWYDDRVEFTEEETAMFLDFTPFDQMPAITIAKFESLEINEDFRFLCRNLSMLIN